MGERICSRCKTMPLLDETEIDIGICGDCADALVEQDNAGREWEYYHPPADEKEAGHG